MYYPVCVMVHRNEALLLIGKLVHVAAAGFLSGYLSGPLPLCLKRYNRQYCVECVVK